MRHDRCFWEKYIGTSRVFDNWSKDVGKERVSDLASTPMLNKGLEIGEIQ